MNRSGDPDPDDADGPPDPALADDIPLPAQPAALVQLSLLLAQEDVSQPALAEVVESDMALAAAVLQAVNRAHAYESRGRVRTVQQAVTFLGTREVAGITFEMGLRAAFPPAPELAPIWKRASLRGSWMGRLARALGLDAWAAHSAGLFEECGKAVLFRHAPNHHRAMLRAARDDRELCELERAGFGIAHDTLGARLCEAWMLREDAVASVAAHVGVQAGEPIDPSLPPRWRGLQALGAVIHAWLQSPATMADTIDRVAGPGDIDLTLLRRAALALPSSPP